jgi:hypothetical protein
MTLCVGCGIMKGPAEFYVSNKIRCRACIRDRSAEWKRNNPGLVRAHKTSARDKYHEAREIDAGMRPARDRLKRCCTIDGCGSKHYAKGFCSKHYQRIKPPRHKPRNFRRISVNDIDCPRCGSAIIKTPRGRRCPACLVLQKETYKHNGKAWRDANREEINRRIKERRSLEDVAERRARFKRHHANLRARMMHDDAIRKREFDRHKKYRETHRETKKAADRAYALNNPEIKRKAKRKYAAKQTRELTDLYVRHLLCYGRAGDSAALVSAELIEAKRTHMKLKRLIKRYRENS